MLVSCLNGKSGCEVREIKVCLKITQKVTEAIPCQDAQCDHDDDACFFDDLTLPDWAPSKEEEMNDF